MTAKTLGVLDRRSTLRELSSPTQQLSIASQARIDSQRRYGRVRRGVERGCGVAGLVRIDSDNHDTVLSVDEDHGRYADFETHTRESRLC